MSADGDEATATLPEDRPHTHDDARAIIKLIQCSQCSYLLCEPMTLPCGNSLCKPCLPSRYKREHVTYPLDEGRSEALICPFTDCGLEHSLGDCSIDVTLSKLMGIVQECIATYKTDEKLGRLVATYTSADMGQLNYDSDDVSYKPIDPESSDAVHTFDTAVLENLKEAIRTELECQVCYQIMLDPLTTSCGHTFCRKCIARVLDHSNLCPMCRRRLPMTPGVQAEPSNKRITHVLQALLPDLLAARQAAADQEEVIDEDANLPLFPCTLAYPHMPTFLHIFEPRYRLMVRRAVEGGSRRFGMLMNNHSGHAQGALGRVHFVQYGTILHIERMEMFPDGRSLIQTRGLSRFRVLETSLLDGYLVGRVQRVDDIPLPEEEALEARETSGDQPASSEGPSAQLDCMSTQRLLEYGLQFVEEARSRSARWLHQRVLAAYGQPPTDPAIFPYWLASVLPIAEEEKYLLLPATSVRERLKITAGWIQRLEAARR